MASWMDRFKADKNDEGGEIKPEDIQKGLGIDELKNRMGGIEETNKAVMEFIADQKKQKEEALAARAAEEAKKNAPPPVELDFYGDPEAAVNEKMKPIIANQIDLTSRMLRKDIFDDAAFEFYTGEVKSRVDNFIDSLPLNQRANPASIKNCYYVVMGQTMAEGKKDELKSRFASSSSAASGTGNTSGKADETPQLSAEEKLLIRQFGISEESYAKNRKETNYV